MHKDKVINVIRMKASQYRKDVGGDYPFRIATWNLRLEMEREYPEHEWTSKQLRGLLMELQSDGVVEKCKHESRIGQAVWMLL